MTGGADVAKEMMLPCPEEDVEQMCLFRWALANAGAHPELELLFHIPNGGKRSKAEAARFKAMGVRAGVSDIFLPVARDGHHGLWIELKRLHNGRPTKAQLEWIERMIAEGYVATVCNGWVQAARVICAYMGIRGSGLDD